MHYGAISNTGSHFEVFESERFTLVCFRILKHGDPVGNQRIVGLFSIIYIILINCVFEFTSNVLFLLRLLLALLNYLCQLRQNLVANLRLLSFF